MRLRGIGFCVMVLALMGGAVWGQQQPPSEKLVIQARVATTWNQAETSIIQLEGPVTIELDRATMSARQAVVWLTPIPGDNGGQYSVEVSLIGDARLEETEVRRLGEELYVTARTRDSIRIVADQRVGRNASDSELYQKASALRPEEADRGPRGAARARWRTPTTSPATRPAPGIPTVRVKPGVRGEIPNLQTVWTSDGTLAAIASGRVVLFQQSNDGDLVELLADNAVLFTRITRENVRQLLGRPEGPATSEVTTRPAPAAADAGPLGAITPDQVLGAVDSIYLEGDVRILYTPARKDQALQRLEANRVFYELADDPKFNRAVLTSAVLHSIRPQRPVPVIIRATTMRQLARDEFQAEHVELTTSAFKTPSYALAADRAYVRTVESHDPREGDRTTFVATHGTLDVFGLPVFYLPVIGGWVTEKDWPVRTIAVENSDRFGTGVRTRWGLFETLGQRPPEDLDLSFTADYLSERGPGGGLDGTYSGGFITETTKEPSNLEGDFQSYIVEDQGTDELGNGRTEVEPPRELRGMFLWKHQHFFPSGWQAQFRASYLSDPTFLEEWFEPEFNNGPPHDVSAYMKRQRDTEAITFLTSFQPNDFVTTADLLQEQLEVERLPEIGYHRIGDSVADAGTFFSDNNVSRLKFKPSDASLADQGFPPGESPGIPSIGWTGVSDDVTDRGDFRQEFDLPLTVGRFRVVPYVLGRYTVYSDSPMDGSTERTFMGTGIRATTAFWKVDDSVRSPLFDLHRLRHVVEPEMNVFTSTQTTDRSELFIYDEPVDAINDISALQLALHQRWQTKRGGPGRWRSVDFFVWNVEGDFFAGQPPESQLDPVQFRGLYFASLPEASIPRNSINQDWTWRISDTTAVLADASYNTDESELATAAIGFAAERDRLRYFIGTRYIEPLDSNIVTFSTEYQLTAVYTLAFQQSFDFGLDEEVSSQAAITRKFDRFSVRVGWSYDAVEDNTAITLNIYPEFLPLGVGVDQTRGVFPQ